MKLRIHKLPAIAALSLGMAGTAVSGDLDSLMDGMFMSTATMPQPYNSSTRNGLFLGSVSLRIPVKNYTLVQYDAPSVSAGCSGISLSAGSFSIMNAEEFKQMIRQIGASAGMYFFKLALNQISPSIMSTLNGLEEFMSKFTLNNLNTCKVGDSIASSAWNGTLKKDFDTVVDGVKKDWTDSFALGRNATDDGVAAHGMTKQESADAAGAENDPSGNIIWRLLSQKDVGAIIGSTSFSPSKTLMMEYMMSMVGIQIIAPVGGAKKADGSSTSAPCPSGAECTDKHTWYPIGEGIGLVPMDFYTGGDGSKKYYWCADSGHEEKECQAPETEEFTFIGTRRYVNEVLYGEVDTQDPQPGSLISNLQEGAELTNEQLSLLLTMPPDFLQNFVAVQKNIGASTLLVEAYEKYMAYAFSVRLVEALVTAVDYARTGKVPQGKLKLQLTEQQEKNLEKVREDLNKMRTEMRVAEDAARGTIETARNIAKTNPKLMYDLNKG